MVTEKLQCFNCNKFFPREEIVRFGKNTCEQYCENCLSRDYSQALENERKADMQCILDKYENLADSLWSRKDHTKKDWENLKIDMEAEVQQTLGLTLKNKE
jgi:hypothetical protein